ncbi:hypothetical protein MJ547_07100 [Burkholderia gladioli]
MTRQQQQAGKPTDEKQRGDAGQDARPTFETDISETGEDCTTVRQAEVRQDDLSEVKPPSSGPAGGA